MTTLARADDDAACATALASLGASPARLRRMLTDHTPGEAWAAIAGGCHPADPDGAFRPKASAELLGRARASCHESSITVHVVGSPRYPAALVGDREAPAVVFTRGDLAALEGRPRVAIVGTRSATPSGRGVATELGSALGDAGVVIVSGLARGIDTAAHRGVLRGAASAPPVAVLGTAIDATLAREQMALRDEVAAAGLLMSELPPGVAGARWWFAVRNRVMAALAHVVVVVECHHTGGALHTVAAAKRRNVRVAAVPGSVRSAASVGTNELLVDGARAVRHAEDVLDVLMEVVAATPGIAWPARVAAPTRGPARPARPSVSDDAVRVRRALDLDPVTLDAVVERVGIPVGDVALALEQLADAGLATEERGWWSVPRR